MTIAEDLRNEQVRLSNALHEIEKLVSSDDFTPLLKLRDSLRGADKKVFDESCWINLSGRSGMTFDNAHAFISNYAKLQTIVAGMGPRRSIKFAGLLQAMHARVVTFLELAPPLFGQIDAFVNMVSLNDLTISPAFESGHFDRQLRYAQACNEVGKLLTTRWKLDQLHFLAYFE